MPFPGRTVRADIRLYIRKITDVRVKFSVETRISVVNRAPISVTPIFARISAYGYRCYEYQNAKFTLDIRGCTDNSTRTSVILRLSKGISKRISKWISKWISTRTVQPGFDSLCYQLPLIWRNPDATVG